VLGYAGTKPIHAVIGWAKTTPEDEKILRIITVHIPQPPSDALHRREGAGYDNVR
jgi:hypothetical protein